MKPEDAPSENKYQEKRDLEAAIEARYEYPKGDDGFSSVLGFIDAEHDSLTQQFWLWRSQNPGGPLGQAVTQWEIYKFGTRLYLSAHGLLMFYVFSTLAPGERPRRYGSLKPGLTSRERKEHLDDALDALTAKREISDHRETGVII